MIPLELQDSLEIRLKKEFEHFCLKNLKGESVPLNIFTQHLPNKSKSNDSQNDNFPYVLIRLSEGEELDQLEGQTTTVLFVVGVVDREGTNQGYRDAVTMVTKIYQSLKRNPVVGKRFELQYPIRWAYHDEDVEPYFFAGLETNWATPKAVMDDVEELI